MQFEKCVQGIGLAVVEATEAVPVPLTNDESQDRSTRLNPLYQNVELRPVVLCEYQVPLGSLLTIHL